MQRIWLPAALVLLVGCGSDDETTAVDPTEPEEPPSCEVGDVVLDDGSCQPPGVPADACGTGFVSDDAGGCVATLPSAPCSGGQIALPGETACRDIVSCGSGTWGDIVTDGSTEHVDSSYSGGASDGSPTSPWTTITEALAAAADGAVVAVAAGDYDEGVAVNRPVTLWGRCPSMVTLRGSGSATSSIVRIASAAGAMVRGVALSGPHGAVVVENGSAELRDLWIYDTLIAVSAISRGTDTSASIHNIRIDRAQDVGVLVLGATVQLSDSVVMDTQPLASGRFGRGIDVEMYSGVAGQLDVQHSIIDGAREFGVYVSGASATIDSTLVRNVEASVDTGEFGRGINVQDNDMGAPSTATISASVIELATESGLDVRDSDVVIDASVVRDTRPLANAKFGHGISLHGDGAGANLTVLRSVIERSSSLAVGAFGGRLELDGVAIRDVAPYTTAGLFGRGFSVQPESGVATSASLRNCVVSGTLDVSLIVFDSAVSIDNCNISGAAARQADGQYGDGINVVGATASLDIEQVLVHDAARAGVGNFGAHVAMGNSTFMCNEVQLNGETLGQPFSFDDRGGNVCGCGEQREDCHVLSSALEPPSVVDGNQ